MIWPGFIGSTDTLRSPNENLEETINFYLAPGTPGAPKQPAWLCPTPGTEPYIVLAEGPVRALFEQDGRAFAVGGTGFYELHASQTYTFIDFVALDQHPATISSNGTAGNQLFITSGGFGYIYRLDTGTFSIITDPFFLTPSAMGAFVDGYFLNLKRNSRQWQFSSLEDGTTWDGLDVIEVSLYSENVVALAVNLRDVWLLGSQNTVVYQDVGDADNPFQPIPGAFLQQGIAGPFTWDTLDNSLFWLSRNKQGQAMVMRANGYRADRVSSYAIEYRLSQYPRLDDVIGWSYQENGHSFLLFYPPTPSTAMRDSFTWVFDASTQQWHQRALWDADFLQWVPHVGRCHCYAFGQHLIGDRRSAAIYRQSLDLSTDTVIA